MSVYLSFTKVAAMLYASLPIEFGFLYRILRTTCRLGWKCIFQNYGVTYICLSPHFYCLQYRVCVSNPVSADLEIWQFSCRQKTDKTNWFTPCCTCAQSKYGTRIILWKYFYRVLMITQKIWRSLSHWQNVYSWVESFIERNFLANNTSIVWVVHVAINWCRSKDCFFVQCNHSLL
jgi:hypothetical protein